LPTNCSVKCGNREVMLSSPSISVSEASLRVVYVSCRYRPRGTAGHDAAARYLYLGERTQVARQSVQSSCWPPSHSPSRPRHVCRNARRTPSSTRRTTPPRCVLATGNIHTVIAATPLPFRRRRCARQGHDTPWTPSMRHRTASLHRGTRSRPPASPPS
jgi:hypothetical protein